MCTMIDRIASYIKNHFDNGLGFYDFDAIHIRDRDRGGLIRISIPDDSTAIVKLWRMRNFKEKIKLVLRLNNGYREWKMHQYLYHHGISTSKPIGFNDVFLKNKQCWEIVAIEDLGTTLRGLDYLKKSIATGAGEDVYLFENQVIDITCNLKKLNIIDIDNQLNNFLVDDNKKVYRIDFECAKFGYYKFHKKAYVDMIARLIATHIYAVQPAVYRTVNFCERLYKCLDIPSHMKPIIQESIDLKLNYQSKRQGVHTSIVLP